MARNEFEDEVKKLLRDRYPFIEKISDAAFNREMERQTSKKPFDFFGADRNGLLIAVEAKRVRVNRFAFAALADHQRQALQAVWDASGLSYLALNFRVKAPGKRCGRAFCIPYGSFIAIERSCLGIGRKSMTPEHIPEIFELDRISGGWKFRSGI